MKRLMNFLRGMVTLRASGLFPERLLNLCAQDGIAFWALEWLDEHTVRLTTRRRTLAQLRKLAQRANCEVEVEGSRGLPDFLLRFRTRYAFLLGLTLSLCAVGILSRFVLTIEVTGNERVSTAVILTQLRQLGVRPGVYGPGLDRKQLAQEALLKLEDLAWMGINLHGTRLEVIVRETIPEPERVDETGYYDIVSEADGIITQVEAEAGEAAVTEGDIVLTGETLISGTVTITPPLYSDLPNRYYETHARGKVWARTWRTLEGTIPVKAEVKRTTGEEKSALVLNLFGRRIEIFGNSSISWAFYDKITKTYQIDLPDGSVLPIFLTRQTTRQYEPETVEIELEAAQAMLQDQLLSYLEQLVGEDGQIDSANFASRVEDGCLIVTLDAECQEEIGKEVPASEERINSGEENAP